MLSNHHKLEIPLGVFTLLDSAIKTTPALGDYQDIVRDLISKTYIMGLESSTNETIIQKISTIETKIDNLSRFDKTILKPTYAEKLCGSVKTNQSIIKKKPESECVLLIYPSSTEHKLSPETIKLAFEKDLNNIRITRMHRVKNGGVLIGANNKEDLATIKAKLSTKLEGKASIRSPHLRCPEIRIVNIPKELQASDIIPLLIKQNDIPTDLESCLGNCKLSTTRFGRKDAIISVNNPLFQILETRGKVYLDFSSLSVVENIYVRTCLNCHNTGHVKSTCPLLDKVICRKCGSAHKSEDCTATSSSCWRCKAYSHINSPPHKYGSNDCIIFQNEQKKLITITNYLDHDC